MEWVIPDLKEKPILPLCPWALAAVGAATGPGCLEQHSGACQTLASSAKAPLAPPEPHTHGIYHGKAGSSTGEMGLIQSCVPAPLSPSWCQPKRQNWSCQAELAFFRDMISLSLTAISASKRHNSCLIIEENQTSNSRTTLFPTPMKEMMMLYSPQLNEHFCDDTFGKPR